MDEVGVRHVRLVHLHEVDAHEERLAGLGRPVEVLERRLLDVLVEERDADDALRRRVDVLAVDLELLARRLPRVAGQSALGHLREHRAQLRGHVGEPGRVRVRVGVEMIEAGVLHLVVALGVGQRVVGLAQMPLAGEEGLVARRLQDRRQRPLLLRQPAALPLEGHRGHAAAVRDAPGLHRRAAGRAARLGVEREERHPLARQAVEARRGHPAPGAAAVGARVAVAEVVGQDQDDVGLLLRGRRRSGQAYGGEQREKSERDPSQVPHRASPWLVSVSRRGRPGRPRRGVNATFSHDRRRMNYGT